METKERRPVAVCYARFSPRPGAQFCESCESQLADLRAWCAANGIEIVGEFQDKALSGGDDWTDRPGMLDAVSATKKGMLFLVRAYDRLYRDSDKALAFRGMVESKGAEIRSITEESANGDSMQAKLVRFIFLWLAEYQREVTRARTKAKMLQHQANGRRMSALPPYGKRIDPLDKNRLIDNYEELEIADQIVGLHRMGESYRGIAIILERAGVKNRGKDKWSHVTIKRILVRFASN
jgi:site-specific DNA recombinase